MELATVGLLAACCVLMLFGFIFYVLMRLGFIGNPDQSVVEMIFAVIIVGLTVIGEFLASIKEPPDEPTIPAAPQQGSSQNNGAVGVHIRQPEPLQGATDQHIRLVVFNKFVGRRKSTAKLHLVSGSDHAQGRQP